MLDIFLCGKFINLYSMKKLYAMVKCVAYQFLHEIPIFRDIIIYWKTLRQRLGKCKKHRLSTHTLKVFNCQIVEIAYRIKNKLNFSHFNSFRWFHFIRYLTWLKLEKWLCHAANHTIKSYTRLVDKIWYVLVSHYWQSVYFRCFTFI